jgi:protein tyrosine phosphatase
MHLEPESQIPPEVLKGYNRFTDMLPNPATRVPLKLIKSRGIESTYYNANFILNPDTDKGDCAVPHHIAAMAPMTKRVESFWRLIHEHSVPTIVMLTGLLEKGIRKCPG